MNVAIDAIRISLSWCFIGKARLKGALVLVKEKHPDVEFQINWLPYFLNPDTPKAGESYRAYLEAKFGGAKQVDRIQSDVAEAGRDAGVEFRFDLIATRPNTLRAHRSCSTDPNPLGTILTKSRRWSNGCSLGISSEAKTSAILRRWSRSLPSVGRTKRMSPNSWRAIRLISRSSHWLKRSASWV